MSKYLCIIVLSFTMTGCDSMLPLVAVKSDYTAAGRLTPGCVRVANSDQTDLIKRYLVEILNKHLADRDINTDNECLLNLDIDINPGRRSPGGNSNIIVIEAIFEITAPNSDKALSSLMLRSQADKESDVIVIAQQLIDKYMDRVYPHAVPVSIPAVKGWTNYDRQGRRLLKSGDLLGALTEFRKAVDAGPDDHGACYNLALSYEAIGDVNQSEYYYGRAVNISDKDLYSKALQRVQAKIKMVNSLIWK